MGFARTCRPTAPFRAIAEQGPDLLVPGREHGSNQRATLSLPSDYLARLVAKMRGVEAREAEVDMDIGSNAADDRMIDAVQETAGDLSREEIGREIMGLNERHQAELVALLWTGRGDAEPEAWEETVHMARERRDTPTARPAPATPSP